MQNLDLLKTPTAKEVNVDKAGRKLESCSDNRHAWSLGYLNSLLCSESNPLPE